MKKIILMILVSLVVFGSGMEPVLAKPADGKNKVNMEEHKGLFTEKEPEEEVLTQENVVQEKAETVGDLLIRPIELISQATNKLVNPKGQLVGNEGAELEKLPSGPKFKFSF